MLFPKTIAIPPSKLYIIVKKYDSPREAFSNIVSGLQQLCVAFQSFIVSG